MGQNDQDNGKGEEPELILVPYLFGQKKEDTAAEQQPGAQPLVMPAEAMPEGAGSNGKGQPDHAVLENGVMDDINTQDREAGEYQGQKGAMDGTGDGSGNAQGIPVYLSDHHEGNKDRPKTQHCCKKVVIFRE
jgi:hypothetical protein